MHTGRRLLGELKPYWRQLSAGFIAMALVTAGNILAVFIFGQTVIDRILMGKNYRLLQLVAAGAVALSLVRGLFSYLMNYLFALVGQRLVVDLRNAVFNQLQRLTLSYHERHRVGETIARLTNDIAIIQSSITNSFGDLFYQSFFFLGILGSLFYLHWSLATLTVVVFPLAAVVVAWTGRKMRHVSHRLQERAADLTAVLQEGLQGIRVIKAFNLEGYERDRFQHSNTANFNAAMKSAQTMALATPLVELVTIAALALVLWYGGTEVIRGRLSPGQLISFFGFIASAIAPITSISRGYSALQQALASADRVYGLLDLEPEIMEAPWAVALDKCAGRVSFSGVSFGYREGQSVLKEIDLDVQPGEVVALVGPSGAGKTSLVNLIPRFYDPVAGQVLVDGHDLRQIETASLRAWIGLVPQETILFNTSVRENIAFGRLDATEDEIISAAKAANAHEFIIGLSQGYETVVGERGSSLSGGQRQRLAIARALLRDPRILILDEATSALDTESERLVQEALERLMRGRTTFVIAHRLSTIKFAQRIVVLKGGKIVEEGTHDELLALHGLYERLYEKQFAMGGENDVTV